MTISTHAGSKVSIGGVATSAIDTSGEFAGLTWVQINEVENLGEFGDEAAVVPFQSMADARVRKGKGARNAGQMQLVCGWDPLDAGQIAVRAAAATSFDYAFKVEANDKLDANDTNSIFYFRAKVMSARRSGGTSDEVVRMRANLELVSEIIEVPATVVP